MVFSFARWEYGLLFYRPFFRENSGDERIYQLHGFANRGFDGLAETHLSFFGAQSCRHVAYQQDALQLRAHVYGHAQHVQRIHPVRIDETRLRPSGIQILQIRFDDEEGAGLAFTGIRVHKDGGLVAVHQCVCEIKTADAEVRHTDALRERAAGEFAGDCDSETIVTEKNVADSGDQDPLRFDGMRFLVFFGEGFHFRGREEKTVAGLAHQADVSAGIFVHDDADVQLALVILFDGFNGGDFAIEREIENVAAGVRPQPDAFAAPDRDAANLKRFERGFIFQRLEFPFVHGASLFTARKPRNAPWSFINCSGGRVSVRSRILRARSSDSRISRFSSSVRVMMRNESISSISAPSNKSPGLSGAIWG